MANNGEKDTANFAASYSALVGLSQSGEVKRAIENIQSVTNVFDAERMRELTAATSHVAANFAGLSDALEASRACAKRFTEIQEQLQPLYSSIAFNYEKLLPAFQPQVFEAAQRVAQAVSGSIPKIDFSGISETFRKAHESRRFIDVLAQTHWPLYFVDREALLKELLALNEALSGDELETAVGEVASDYLDEEWLNETRERWQAIEVVNEEERTLLLDAMSRHESGDYVGSTSILMCLFEGFGESFVRASSALANVDSELFDWEAEKHGLSPLLKKNGEAREPRAKDNVLLLLLQTEQGWLTWKAASSYVIDVVLTNDDDAVLMERNPLRNKICHGVQTNYGTWRHSAKAILATDMLLRMGAIAIAAAEAKDSGAELEPNPPVEPSGSLEP